MIVLCTAFTLQFHTESKWLHSWPQMLPFTHVDSCTTSVQEVAELASHGESRQRQQQVIPGSSFMLPITAFYMLRPFNTNLNAEIKVIYVYQVPTLTHFHKSHLLCPYLPCLSQEEGDSSLTYMLNQML